MTYDKQDLLLDLRKLAAPGGDQEIQHGEADRALLRFIDDERVTAAFDAIEKWYA